MSVIRLTMAQAMVRYLANQYVYFNNEKVPYFAGVWAIFGHGNVAGLGEALYNVQESLPTYRAHNEQGMAHAAIAYAKTIRRQRAMICTSSIGPGATNMVTAAALAYVNRLPVLFLPGDVFAGRGPDPVLQQIENFGDGTVSANDCFRPVSRYFDRITRPEQIMAALPRAMATLTDPVDCGPVTLAICQDVQAEAYDYPLSFFKEKTWRFRRPRPDAQDMAELLALISKAEKPMIVAGGGVLYSQAEENLARLAEKTGIPVAETQGGKGCLNWQHNQNLGSIGVTGSAAANFAAEQADLVIGIGTRLQDFTTGSRALFSNPARQLVQINVATFDAHKHGAHTVIGDAREILEELEQNLKDYQVSTEWGDIIAAHRSNWNEVVDVALQDRKLELPTDADVIGAVDRAADDDAIIVCAAGGLPGELHKLWRTSVPGGYHVEYGYSCMGYEIAGGVGARMAAPDREVYVMVGDGSYMMMNSEIATAVMLGLKLVIVVLDNRGFACINRLQNDAGGASFNNLLGDTNHKQLPDIDFTAHATSLGADGEKVNSILQLEAALKRAKSAKSVSVIVIDTDPMSITEAGGHWWDVAVPEVSSRKEVNEARMAYEDALKNRLANEEKSGVK